MRLVLHLALAAVAALAIYPAHAQTPANSMPPGTQNPALVQPQLVAPPRLIQPAPLPSAPPPEAAPPGQTPPSAGVPIAPGGAGGLCECLNSRDLSASVFDKTKVHRVCLASVDACQAACNTQYLFSFVPHSNFTCPGPPEGTGPVAMNMRSLVHLLSVH